MNFRDMTKDEKDYYEHIRVRDDDLDVLIAILGGIAAVVFIGLLMAVFM